MAKRNHPLERGPSIFDRLEQSKVDKLDEILGARFSGLEPLPIEFNKLIADVMCAQNPIMIMRSNFEQSLAGRLAAVFSRFAI